MSSINTNPNQAGNREFQNNNWHRGLWKSVLWQIGQWARNRSEDFVNNFSPNRTRILQ